VNDRPPLIGIIGRVMSFADEGRRDAFSSSQPYSRAVATSGGLPVLLPPLPRAPQMADHYLDQLDGLLLPGGGDVEPHRYGQQPTTDSLYGMVSLHDEFDLAMVRAAIARDMPVLAICRGMQELNVALGGRSKQARSWLFDGRSIIRAPPLGLQLQRTRRRRSVGRRSAT
jgi:putative glutamine amidotransferase